MENLNVLIESVESRKPISFEYNIPEKKSCKGIGNVHAIYMFNEKSGEKSTNIHIVLTANVSDSCETIPVSNFKSFNILELSNIKILKGEPRFKIHKYYNSEWDGYYDPIAMV